MQNSPSYLKRTKNDNRVSLSRIDRASNRPTFTVYCENIEDCRKLMRLKIKTESALRKNTAKILCDTKV